MSAMIQPLESRVLLSTTTVTLATDVAAVKSAAASAKASLGELHAAEVSLHSTVVDNVLATETKSQKKANLKLNALLNKADTVAAAKITAGEAVLVAGTESRVAVVAGLGKTLITHPTKTTLAGKIATDVSAGETLLSTKLSAFDALVSTELADINAVYSDVAIEDPTAASDISTGEAGVTAAESAYVAAVAGIQTAVTQLGTDLTAI
jgi:hypothetical protein